MIINHLRVNINTKLNKNICCILRCSLIVSNNFFLFVILAPCTIPTSEHGKYLKNKPFNRYTNDTGLTISTEIQNEELVMFACEFGYNLQVRISCA